MAEKKITVTYEIVTPESAEEGDVEERGWVDEEGESMAPDKYDREEGLTAVDKAVEYLRDNGATEPSDSIAARWWTNYEYDEDFRTGGRESRSYHLEGFTEKEREEIQRAMRYKGNRRTKANPLRKGYSRAVVSDNISTMVHEGYPQKQAVAASLSSARKSYRSRHPRGRFPGHLQRARANPEVETGHVYGQIGDINPLDYSGGVVYQSGYGEPVLEWTHGLEGIEGVGPYDEDVEDVELEVYRVPIADDVVEEMDWVDWKDVASSIGMPVSELKEHAKSDNVMARASVYEAIAGYYGWGELDTYPERYKYSELEKTWFPGGYLAKKMRVHAGGIYEPNPLEYYEEHPDEWVSYSYGQMPTKKIFMEHLRKDPDDSYGMLLRGDDDARAARGTVFAEAVENQAYFDNDEMYQGVKQLVKKYDRGNEQAGDLASSILYTLGFEWV